MSTRPRPLSPHLTIYRWPITMILSILHRGTGLVLTSGLMIFAFWLGSIALGESYYSKFLFLSTTWIGSFFLFSLSFAFFLHFSNGIRHLYWDTGRGFNKDNVELSARLVIISTFIFTTIFWWWI